MSAHSTGKSFGRVVELVAELACAREDAARAPAAAQPFIIRSARPRIICRPELLLLAFGTVRQAAERLQPALGERQRLAESEEADRVLCGREVVMGARGKISRRFEQDRQARRASPACRSPCADERAGHASAERRPSRRLQRRVEHVLVQHVHELVLQRERQVRELVLVAALHEDVHPLEHVEPLFDVGRDPSRGLR